MTLHPAAHSRSVEGGREDGFSLVELLISTVILTGLAGFMFSTMADMHRTSVAQGEIHAAQSNLRMVTGVLEHYVTQAAYNPRGIAMEGVVISSSTQVRLRADVTGSSTADSNRGDPDGDTNDLDEDVTLRYRSAEQRLELVLPDKTVRPVAEAISEFNMQYLDRNGNITAVGSEVTVIQFTVGAATQNRDLSSRYRHAIRQTFDIRLQSR